MTDENEDPLEFVRRIASGDLEILDASPVEREIVQQAAQEVYRGSAEGMLPSPALVARVFRELPAETGEEIAYRESRREMLREYASAGDELSAEVLALLADDPFWAD